MTDNSKKMLNKFLSVIELKNLFSLTVKLQGKMKTK
jgi:hypothetical protein